MVWPWCKNKGKVGNLRPCKRWFGLHRWSGIKLLYCNMSGFWLQKVLQSEYVIYMQCFSKIEEFAGVLNQQIMVGGFVGNFYRWENWYITSFMCCLPPDIFFIENWVIRHSYNFVLLIAVQGPYSSDVLPNFLLISATFTFLGNGNTKLSYDLLTRHASQL